MVALQIEEVGTLLNKMLKGDLFDRFLLREASISQGYTATIDGTLRPGFYTEEECSALGLTGLSYLPFAQVRPVCLDLMKGSKKPESFRFVFLLSPENQASTIAASGASYQTEDITGLFLNLNYKNGALLCTTGISYRTFSLDKSLETEWDRMVALFFRQHGIAVTEV